MNLKVSFLWSLCLSFLHYVYLLSLFLSVSLSSSLSLFLSLFNISKSNDIFSGYIMFIAYLCSFLFFLYHSIKKIGHICYCYLEKGGKKALCCIDKIAWQLLFYDIISIFVYISGLWGKQYLGDHQTCQVKIFFSHLK